MVIIPEDGSGVTGANSYVTLAFADEYFSTHPFYSTEWEDLANDRRSALVVASTNQLDQLFNWFGFRSYNEQLLDWPRQRVWLADNYDYAASNSIPLAIKKATCEMAFFLSKGDAFSSSNETLVDSVKIDVIELHFNNSRRKAPVPAGVLTLLRGLGDYAFGGRVRKVLVG